MNKKCVTLKAARIIAKLAMMFRPAQDITVEELLSKCSSYEELDFYYTVLCTRREQDDD